MTRARALRFALLTAGVRQAPESCRGELPDALWEARHRWMLRILYLHLPALLVVAVLYGNPVWHALEELSLMLALVMAAGVIRSRRGKALLSTTALLTCSALLVHFTDGLLEAHFHFFVAVTLLGFYEDRTIYGLAVGYVLIHHGVLGTVFADSEPIFAHPAYPGVSAWTWATVHAGFILLAGLANMLLARMNQNSRRTAAAEAERRARAEATTRTLADTFVPSPLPALDGRASVAAAYLPGDGNVGGDFYNVVDLEDGRIGIGVGDVAGHGAQVAGLTSRLRHTLRAYALDGLQPATVMDKLERALEGDGSATCAYLVIDPDAETVSTSLAGHLPPVIVRPDGEIEMLGGGLSVPLAGIGVAHVQATHSLPAGSTVIVYTDGLVERREESIDVGLRRLRAAIDLVGPDPDALCERLPGLLLEGGAQSDDVAVVALRVGAVPGGDPSRARDRSGAAGDLLADALDDRVGEAGHRRVPAEVGGSRA